MESRESARLITIGEFAHLGGVSIKALRLYARLGLLAPAVVKPESRHRLYTRAQLSRLQRILLFKNAGLALAQISGQLTHRDESALSQIRESLVKRGEEIQRQLAWVDAEIQAARTSSGSDVPRVVIKQVPKATVSSQRERIDSYDQADSILRDLANQLPRSALLVSGAIWHDCGARTRIIDCEAFWILSRTAHTATLKELAPATVASILHEGDESTIGSSYETARRWITDNRFKIIGPNREIYLSPPASELGDALIEIQFPIRDNK
jgi:DNA-binding transcriptional MerR regulator